MNRKHYYLHAYREKANHAGSKAVDDCEKIMHDLGYEQIDYHLGTSENKYISKIQKLISELKLFKLRVNGVLVVEHPIYIKREYLNVLRILKKVKNLKLVFIIHDLESARHLLSDSYIYEKRDRIVFEIADVIIVHNNSMKNFLIDQGVSSERLVSLEIFDYLVDEANTNCEKLGEPDGIAIAGNLDPNTCGYIYTLPLSGLNSTIFNLYGVNYKETKGCQYCGSFSPDDLPAVMNGKYGLVWYGNDLSLCGGKLETYLQYINPHKVSSYLAAGMPVIISDNIGLKDFIVKNGLGIAIHELTGLEKKLDAISEEEYKTMKNNVTTLMGKLNAGEFLRAALDKANNILD